MSTGVPAPRMDGDYPGGLDASTWQVLAAIERLRAEITQRFDVLPERFLPRPEAESRFEIGARDREALHADVEDLKAALEGERDQRNRDRKWALGVAVSVLIAIATISVTLYVGLQHR